MSAGFDYWLFDLDGTIVDVEPSYIHEILAKVGQKIGYSFSEQQAERLWHGLGGPPESHLRSWGIEPNTFWEAFHAIEEPQARAEATFLYPDARAIGSLDRPVGLVTHCQPYLTEPVLSALDIADWFDVVVCCHDGIGWKPDPGPVKHAIRELEHDETEHAGVLAGNTTADVGAARNAGITGVHVERHDPHRRGYCIRADERIRGFEDILAAEG